MKKCRISQYDIFLCGGSERPVRRDMNTLIRDFTSESGFRLSGGIAGDAAVPHGGLHSAETRVVSPSSEKGGAAGVRCEEG